MLRRHLAARAVFESHMNCHRDLLICNVLESHTSPWHDCGMPCLVTFKVACLGVFPNSSMVQRHIPAMPLARGEPLNQFSAKLLYPGGLGPCQGAPRLACISKTFPAVHDHVLENLVLVIIIVIA